MSGATSRTPSVRYLYLSIGVVGFASTVLLVNPDAYTATAGPLRFDVYYAATYGFLFMTALSLYRLYESERE